MRIHLRTLSAALLLCLALPGCSNDTPAAGAQGAQDKPGFIARAAKEAGDEAREELARNDIDLNADGQPKAAITPKGDLLIDGKPVAMDEAQRKLALEYRAGITAIAEAGIEGILVEPPVPARAVTCPAPQPRPRHYCVDPGEPWESAMNRPVRPWTRTITQATTGAVAALLVASWIIGTPATRAAPSRATS